MNRETHMTLKTRKGSEKMRKTFSTILLIALLASAPAFAVTVNFGGTSAANNINVTLVIGSYAQVNWQDSDIVFSSNISPALDADYESTTLSGSAYTATAQKPADDPWAGVWR